jgi:hypothetical protein
MVAMLRRCSGAAKQLNQGCAVGPMSFWFFGRLLNLFEPGQHRLRVSPHHQWATVWLEGYDKSHGTQMARFGGVGDHACAQVVNFFVGVPGCHAAVFPANSAQRLCAVSAESFIILGVDRRSFSICSGVMV